MRVILYINVIKSREDDKCKDEYNVKHKMYDKHVVAKDNT